jgi:hypothetical protein
MELQSRLNGETHLHSWVETDDGGNFTLSGSDLAPRDEWGDVSEYEWDTTVRSTDVPALVELLGGSPGQDVLDIIERDWVQLEGAGIERLIRESGIKYQTQVWRR